MTMTLVDARTGPKVTGIPTSGLMLIVGDTKAGKTTLAASFPKSYVIELEHKRADRLAFGRIDDLVERFYQLPEPGPGETPPDRDHWLLDTFGEVLQAAMADPEVKTIVIDSADELQKLIAAEVSRDNGVEFLSQPKEKVDNRALWGEYSRRIMGMTDFLKECGKLVVIVCHRREAKLDKDNHITKPAGINVSGAGGDYMAKHAEIIGFMDVRNIGGRATYFLTFKGESQRAIWRSGVEELSDKEIVISKADPYGSFAAAFARSKPAAAAPQLVPAKSNGKTAARKR